MYTCTRPCTRHGRVQVVFTALTLPCSRAVYAGRAVYTVVYTAVYTGRVHGHVRSVYTCTQPCTRPCTGRVHGRVCAVYTAQYTAVYTVVYAAVYTCRVRGRVRAVYTCTRTRVHCRVRHTARTQPCACREHGRVYGRVDRSAVYVCGLCTRPYMTLHARVYGRLQVYTTVQGRCTFGRVQAVYTVVYMAVETARVQSRVLHGPCTR